MTLRKGKSQGIPIQKCYAKDGDRALVASNDRCGMDVDSLGRKLKTMAIKG